MAIGTIESDASPSGTGCKTSLQRGERGECGEPLNTGYLVVGSLMEEAAGVGGGTGRSAS